MTAPRDGVMILYRSTQLHESWDHGLIIACRAEFLRALPSNVKRKFKGMWSPIRERWGLVKLIMKGKKEHL
jgi:hypothetical protein